MPPRIHLLVDGNSFFHSCKASSIPQDFDALELGVLTGFKASSLASKTFYTRPPLYEDGKRVAAWLRSHGWDTHVFNYDKSHQDTLYVSLVTDLLTKGYHDEIRVVVSGSGSLLPPLRKLMAPVHILTLQESLHRGLQELADSRDNISIHNLVTVMHTGSTRKSQQPPI